MAVRGWVKDLTEGVLGGPPVQIGKYYEHPEDGEILITGGQYWGRDGLSNFWYWEVCATGEKHHGYGREWPRINVPEKKAVVFMLSTLQHACENRDIEGADTLDWCTWLLHQCAIARFEYGYINKDPRE